MARFLDRNIVSRTDESSCFITAHTIQAKPKSTPKKHTQSILERRESLFLFCIGTFSLATCIYSPFLNLSLSLLYLYLCYSLCVVSLSMILSLNLSVSILFISLFLSLYLSVYISLYACPLWSYVSFSTPYFTIFVSLSQSICQYLSCLSAHLSLPASLSH